MVQPLFLLAGISETEFCHPNLKGKAKRQRKMPKKHLHPNMSPYSGFGEMQPLNLMLEDPILETELQPEPVNMVQSILSDELVSKGRDDNALNTDENVHKDNRCAFCKRHKLKNAKQS